MKGIIEMSKENQEMRYFKEEVKTRISGQVIKAAEMRVTPQGANVTSCRAVSTGQYGSYYCELVGWSEKGKSGIAEAMNEKLGERGVRFIAIGTPSEDIYNDKVQHKLNVKKLWVEDGEGLVLVIDEDRDEEEKPRPPLKMPTGVGI